MKRLMMAFLAALMLCALVAQAQAQTKTQPAAPTPAVAPQPGPEHKKLAVWLGEWTYEGESKATSSGPAGKFTGKISVKSILDGFFIQFTGEETDTAGNVVKWIEIDGYDPVKKRFTWNTFSSDGGTIAITYTLDGANMKHEGTILRNGKQIKLRGTIVFGADFLSWVQKDEISVDGKKWMPSSESKGTKVKAP